MMWIAIGFGVVLFLAYMFVMFAVVPKILLKKVQAKLAQRVADEIPTGQVVREDLLVISFGLDSRGVTQGRGNGALVLTPTELRWLQLKPRSSDVTIERSSITAVDTTKSHLGKSYGKPLLHVSFTHDGEPDSMAWYTTDVPGWIASLGGAGESEQRLDAG